MSPPFDDHSANFPFQGAVPANQYTSPFANQSGDISTSHLLRKQRTNQQHIQIISLALTHPSKHQAKKNKINRPVNRTLDQTFNLPRRQPVSHLLYVKSTSGFLLCRPVCVADSQTEASPAHQSATTQSTKGQAPIASNRHQLIRL